MKLCGGCRIYFPEADFTKNPSMRDGLNNRCKECRKLYRMSFAGKESKRRSRNKWRQKNLEKRKAHDAVHYALQAGKLEKRPCACGDKEVEAHHEDYSKPLEVNWMCFNCHKEYHAKNRK